MMHYILDANGNPIVENDMIKWALWFADTQRRGVARTELPGDITVSTVFLGLDHGFGGEILLYETMIFGGEHDQYQEWYTTRDEALEGHERAVVIATSPTDPAA